MLATNNKRIIITQNSPKPAMGGGRGGHQGSWKRMVMMIMGMCCVLVDRETQAWICHPTTTTTTSYHRQQAKRTSNHHLTPFSLAATSSTSSTTGTASVANTPEYYLNPLIDSIKPSKTVEIFSKVKEMEASGTVVTSLCVGEPDFLPSPVVLEAIIQAVRNGDTRYTAVTGTVPLRRAIAKDLKRRKGVEYNPLTEIVVGNGAKQSVYQGILAVAGMGDKVIVPAPYWPSYPEMVLLAGATPIIVETTPANGFLLTAEQLRTVLEQHPQTKLIILCNPSNPTGGVYTLEQLQELCKVLEDFPTLRCWLMKYMND